MNKEFRRKVIELVDWKKQIDKDSFLLREQMKDFNKRVKDLTGKEHLDYEELVLMLCHEEYVPSTEDIA